jgi:hypothetical protein
MGNNKQAVGIKPNMVQHGALHLFVCGALCRNVDNQTKDDMTRQEAINGLTLIMATRL